MVAKVMISLSGRNQKWFDSLSKKDRIAYLKTHPKSKFGSGVKKAAKPSPKAAAKPKSKTPAKPAAKTVKKKTATVKRPAVDAKKKVVKKDAAKKPVAKKTAAKKTPVKKAAVPAKKKATPRKKAEIKVHKDTDKMHDQAMQQKKAHIDKVIAPYARELGQLRNKRDSGGGLSNDESKRYKALLETITKLHRGRNG